MSHEIESFDLPEEVRSVNIKEQKVVDGLTFPLILSPTDAFQRNDADFWNGWVRKNLKAIENLLLNYGAILFRGFPFHTPKEFDEFSKAYGYDPFLNVFGGGVRYPVVGNVYTSGTTPPSLKIPMHHEMAHVNDYPHILFFYCDIPATEGGNSPLTLSNVVYRKMDEHDPELVSRLKKEGLRYSRIAPNGNDERNPYGRSWQSTCFTSNREEAEINAKAFGFDFEWLEGGSMKLTTEVLPAIRVEPRTGKEMWFNTILAYHLMSRYEGDTNKWTVIFPNGDEIRDETVQILQQIIDDAKVSFKWQHKDVILVDNRIAMHSKDDYSAPPRRILISFFQDHHGPI